MQMESLGDCLYRFGFQLCKVYMTSHVGVRQHNVKSQPVNAPLLLSKLKTFSTIELAFERYPELLKKVDLVVQKFKCETSLAFCNLIGPPRSVRVDPRRYRQSPRPSLLVFILEELNAEVGAVCLAA